MTRVSTILKVAAILSLTTFGVASATPVAPVPEPSTWAMMLVGFGAIGVLVRRRHRAELLSSKRA